MKPKILLVCDLNPYPVVKNGIERLLFDYERQVFSDFDVYFLYYYPPESVQLLHYGEMISELVAKEELLEQDFQFVLFFNWDTPIETDIFLNCIRERFPSFLFLQKHPVAAVKDWHFRGIIAFSSLRMHENVFLPGGFYDSRVFRKNGRSEEWIVTVGRIHPDKNQLELVQGYKERIYQRYGLPLLLVGGGRRAQNGENYFEQVFGYVDNVSVRSSVDPDAPSSPQSWFNPAQIAAACNRARIFVMASPEETFCVALLEAMACGATCVVNGSYPAFQEAHIQPHLRGNIRQKQGSVLDLLEEVLRNDVRLDASEWVKQYSLQQIKPRLLEFIERRLPRKMSYAV